MQLTVSTEPKSAPCPRVVPEHHCAVPAGAPALCSPSWSCAGRFEGMGWRAVTGLAVQVVTGPRPRVLSP